MEDYIARYCDYKIWNQEGAIPDEVLLEEAKQAEGLLVANAKISAAFLKQAPHLKVISNTAVGYESFDLEAMKEYKVISTHTPYVLDETVADLVFSLVLSTARRVPQLNNFVK